MQAPREAISSSIWMKGSPRGGIWRLRISVISLAGVMG
jgi:hypothetical protein